VIALALGFRPERRVMGILLCLPLISVSVFSWIAGNPFNGTLFALISIALIILSLRLPGGRIQVGPIWMIITGTLITAFGWTYPHFLQASSFWPYLIAAPVGLIPCATLSITIGLAIVLMGLNSRAWSLVLGVSGLVFGLTGAMWLGVQIDWILFIGAAILVLAVLLSRREMAVSAART
jgi:hypothetical protein